MNTLDKALPKLEEFKLKESRKPISSTAGRALAVVCGFAMAGAFAYYAQGTFARGKAPVAKQASGILPPKNITATGGDGTVLLTWSPVPNATGYTVIQVGGRNSQMSKQKESPAGWPDGKDTAYVDRAVFNGTPQKYVMTAWIGNTHSEESKPVIIATPQKQAGSWSIVYTPKVSTVMNPSGVKGIDTQGASKADGLSVSAEINGIVKGKPKTGRARAARGGYWTATWHPSKPGAWPTILSLDRETEANYVVDCTGATGKAKLTSADGSVTVVAPDPAKPGSYDSGFQVKESWDTSDPSRPINTVHKTHDNYGPGQSEEFVVRTPANRRASTPAKSQTKGTDTSAVKGSAKEVVKKAANVPPKPWRRWLTRKTSIKTYYTSVYLHKHFANPGAIVIKVPAAGMDITSSVVANSATTPTSVVSASYNSTDTLTGQ